MSIFSRNKPPRVKRTAFNLSHEKVLSTNFGRLTPIYVEEVVPGDKFSVQTELLVKLAPMASPAFSRIDCAIHYFFVPNRIIWDGWERWISGTQTGQISSTSQKDEYMPPFPSYTADLTTQDRRNAHAKSSLFDYMTGTAFSVSTSQAFGDVKFNRLPFHAYQMIYDEYFRDENVGRVPIIQTRDGMAAVTYSPLRNVYGIPGDVNLTDFPSTYDNIITNGLLQIQYACWRKDYFTSALPWTQRGDDAKLIIDSSITGALNGNFTGSGTLNGPLIFNDVTGTGMTPVPSLEVKYVNTGQDVRLTNRDSNTLFNKDGEMRVSNTGRFYANQGGSDTYHPAGINPKADSSLPSTLQTVQGDGVHSHSMPPMSTNVSHQGQFGIPQAQFQVTDAPAAVVGGIKVNDVRRAFQLQRWLERTARGGYRYIEQILAHFGVYSSDKRLDRPEHLGGGKIPVVVGDIYQTSDNSKTSGGTNTGNRAGHGNAYGSAAGFKNKHIEEHGYIIGVLTSRPRSVYMQGIDRTFLKGAQGDRFDFYWPEFAHIGEQPVYNAELYLAAGQGTSNMGTFGYTPRYHEYRYHRSTIHGDFRDNLAFWHQGRQFSSLPTLNPSFLECSDATNYRPFYDTTSGTDHLWCFMTNHVHALRPIPRFSDPGYADH
ncbi:MAG: hypothetical protein Pg6B_10440 [Candidatus Azobacteroides pseudotrichonymphae]|nr:MAG: hypothetical protein Pg6B_10440 [Candidatus Azobacteroides pseudotrichonymphae]